MSPVQDALVQVCGGEEMADRATQLWDDIKTKNRLDVSDQNLSDDDVKCLIKGLHMCDTCHACPGEERGPALESERERGPARPRDRVAKTQDETYANERTKPFPLTELDFSG